MRLKDTFHVTEQALHAVMSTVHYFDIFKHPLRENEIFELLHHHPLSRAELSATLSYLTGNLFLFEQNGYFLPHPEFEFITRRIEGKKLSESYWKTAQKKSRLISRFPFTRCVLISGSLSKGYMDEHSDIDYLIITKPGRLWLARTLLVLYKKIFLLNSHKFFCVNYFLDQDHLVLTDRNLFTATELVFAKPVYNLEMHRKFIEANQWTKTYYPSLHTEVSNDPALPHTRLKTFLEAVLSGYLGEKLDRFCMKISDKFWQRKFSSMSREQYLRDMKSDKGVSKHHPNGFRDKILNEHQQRMQRFREQVLQRTERNFPESQPVFQS